MGFHLNLMSTNLTPIQDSQPPLILLGEFEDEIGDNEEYKNDDSTGGLIHKDLTFFG